MESFGGNLKIARTKKGLTQRDVALKVGISHVFLGEVEREVKLRVGEKHWPKLAKALGVKLSVIEEWNRACYCPFCNRLL